MCAQKVKKPRQKEKERKMFQNPTSYPSAYPELSSKMCYMITDCVQIRHAKPNHKRYQANKAIATAHIDAYGLPPHVDILYASSKIVITKRYIVLQRKKQSSR